MTHAMKQFSDNERIRLRFLSGSMYDDPGASTALEKEIRSSLLSEEEARQQCDLMAELIFALCSELQRLRNGKEPKPTDRGEPLEKPAADSIGE